MFKLNTSYAPDVHVKKEKSRMGSFACMAKLAQHKPCSVLALYCVKVNFGNVDGMYFQPIPQSRSERTLGKYQEFCFVLLCCTPNWKQIKRRKWLGHLSAKSKL